MSQIQAGADSEDDEGNDELTWALAQAARRAGQTKERMLNAQEEVQCEESIFSEAEEARTASAAAVAAAQAALASALEVDSYALSRIGISAGELGRKQAFAAKAKMEAIDAETALKVAAATCGLKIDDVAFEFSVEDDDPQAQSGSRDGSPVCGTVTAIWPCC